LEKRTKALVEQRRLERACLEQECVKMERQKKYLEAMLRYHDARKINFYMNFHVVIPIKVYRGDGKVANNWNWSSNMDYRCSVVV
jgi:hypothetical protein